MTTMKDIKEKSDAELLEVVDAARKEMQVERFKDRFSRKSGIIKNAKTTVARALTELSTRRRNNETK